MAAAKSWVWMCLDRIFVGVRCIVSAVSRCFTSFFCRSAGCVMVEYPSLSSASSGATCRVCFNCPCGCCCHGMLSQEMLVFWLSSCMAFVYHSACLIRDADRQVFCSVGGEDWSCGM